MFLNSIRKLRVPSALAFAGLCSAFVLSPGAYADSPSAEDIAEGKKIAFSRKKGNCLACHAMDDGTLAGNGGPPLIVMKVRYPDIKVLRAQIWDATERNPNSIMPPFGRHGILNDDEIDKVVAYVSSL